MNLYGIIILAALLAEYGLGVVSSVLNLRSLSEDLPSEFEGVYDAEAYSRSQEYTRETSRFSLFAETIQLPILLLFWFLGGFDWVDQWARSFGWGSIWTGLVFVGALVVAQGILSLPFGIYSTFVIEERYGFNKTTAWTFVTDLLKGLALAAILGAPLLAGILSFFEYAGSWAWIYCWAAVTAWMLVIQFIAPTWIMPLFNKFEPLESGQLRDAILSYASRVQFPLDNVYVMDGSKRSGKANAFFMGFGRHKRVALFDTLVEKQTVQELVAVLAHEVGHYKKRHIAKGVVISVLHTGLLLWLLSFFLTRPGLFEAFYLEQTSIYAGMVFFALLFSPLEIVMAIAMNAFSRRHEFEADRFAGETLKGAGDLISGLKKLARTNLTNLTPHPFYVFLNYSHPPMLERLKALEGLSPEP